MSPAEISEAVWQNQVEQLADVHQWIRYHTHNSQRSNEGFPDLTLVHPTRHRIVFAELKKESGKTSPAQDRWIAALSAVPGVEAYVWRPSDEIEVQRILSSLTVQPQLAAPAPLDPTTLLEGLPRLAVIDNPVLDGSSALHVSEVVRVADLTDRLGAL